jgi:hypothetical protein
MRLPKRFGELPARLCKRWEASFLKYGILKQMTARSLFDKGHINPEHPAIQAGGSNGWNRLDESLKTTSAQKGGS